MSRFQSPSVIFFIFISCLQDAVTNTIQSLLSNPIDSVTSARLEDGLNSHFLESQGKKPWEHCTKPDLILLILEVSVNHVKYE